jgi:hypothetical protein
LDDAALVDSGSVADAGDVVESDVEEAEAGADRDEVAIDAGSLEEVGVASEWGNGTLSSIATTGTAHFLGVRCKDSAKVAGGVLETMTKTGVVGGEKDGRDSIYFAPVNVMTVALDCMMSCGCSGDPGRLGFDPVQCSR